MLCEDLHDVVGQFMTSKIKTDNGMRKSITFIDWNTGGDTISRDYDNISGIDGEDWLDARLPKVDQLDKAH